MSKISILPEPTKEVCDFLIDKSKGKPVGEKYSYMEVAKLVTGYTSALEIRIKELEEGLREFLSYKDFSKHILTSQGVLDIFFPIFKQLLTKQ